MKNIPRMSRARRRQLVAAGRRTKEAATALRFHAVAEMAAGRSRNVVARKLSLAVSTVTTIAKRYLEQGLAGLFDQRRHNGRRKVDGTYLKELREVLRWTPDVFGWQRFTWTRELLCEEMARRGRPRVAVCTMGRALRDLGARLGRAKPIVLCPWPARRRKRRLKRLEKLAAACSAAEPVYFVDEVDIDLNPRIGRDWMLPGEQRRVVTPGKNKKHYIAGALHAKSRKLTWVEGTTKTSTLFCKLLFRLAAKHRRAKRVHLILDNYVIHKSRFTQRVLASLGRKIRLHFLPPYCPDSNPIERVWLDMHATVTRNHRCKTLLDLGRQIIAFLDHYDGRRTLNPALRPRYRGAA
jgi:transposase